MKAIKDLKVGTRIIDVDGDTGVIDKIEIEQDIKQYYVQYDDGRYGWIYAIDIVEVEE